MKSIFTSILFSLLFSAQSYGQENHHIDFSPSRWEDNKDGYVCLQLPKTNFTATLPAEFLKLKSFSIFNIPFHIEPATAGKFATTTKGIEQISIDLPTGTREVLFVMVADFPIEEISRSWALPTPLNLLNEPERAFVKLIYNDGEIDGMIPVNADFKCYGISHGRALYSVTAQKGKTISKMIFVDNMRNAKFQILAVTANKRLMPRIIPPNDNLWYPEVKKVPLSKVDFVFDTNNGFSWKGIESKMLPNKIDLNQQPVFMMVCEGVNIPSTEWKLGNYKLLENAAIYTITYQEKGYNLKAILKTFKTSKSEITMSMEVINLGNNKVNGQLIFPIISNLKIGNAEETWYAYARNGLIINKINCSYHDYLGSEKPLQFDGIFNPSMGVGLGIFPRDTTDFFRWYNFSKDNDGVNYAIEYTPVAKSQNEIWKSIPVALAIISGDWKEQYQNYKNWLYTWYRKSTPILDWFKQTFSFAYHDNDPKSNHDFTNAAMDFKTRFGNLDYFHIFGWANTEKFGHWGDYSHYESVGGKTAFAKKINTFQTEKSIPVGLYLDGYLMTDKAEKLSLTQKNNWAIKQADGKPFRDYNSYVLCPYVKEWRNFIIERFKEVYKITGAKGLYCDELGMSLRSRVCYDNTHGHEIPAYMTTGENLMMMELKAALPDVAIYNEFGGTDVMTQYNDGGLTYITSWNSYSPEFFNVTGNVPYSEIAPFYLDLRRFTFPDFKTFDVIMTQTPWRNGNWSLLKFPFFNGNSYFHRTDDGKNADPEAVAMFKKIRFIQDKYKLVFSSNNVEPLLETLFKNTFVNRFSSANASVYTVYNANFRKVNDVIIKVKHRSGVTYKDIWNNKPVKIVKIEDGFDYLSFEITPRDMACIVME